MNAILEGFNIYWQVFFWHDIDEAFCSGRTESMQTMCSGYPSNQSSVLVKGFVAMFSYIICWHNGIFHSCATIHVVIHKLLFHTFVICQTYVGTAGAPWNAWKYVHTAVINDNCPATVTDYPFYQWWRETNIDVYLK